MDFVESVFWAADFSSSSFVRTSVEIELSVIECSTVELFAEIIFSSCIEGAKFEPTG